MSTVKSKKLQVGTDATSSNNFTIYQPSTPDGTLRIGVGNADSPTEVGRFTSAGYKPATAPAFRAYLSANQSISAGTFTKINIDTETFDTDSCYDTTNKRFTPTVAGYYQVNGVMRGYGTPSNFMQVVLYKNGSGYESGQLDEYANTNAGLQMTLSTLVYLNGTTDYIELWGYIAGTSPAYQYFSSLNTCWFSATLVRAT